VLLASKTILSAVLNILETQSQPYASILQLLTSLLFSFLRNPFYSAALFSKSKIMENQYLK